MKFSVIIPTLPSKNQDYLNLCVNSFIQNSSNNYDFEVLKAENGEGTPYPQGQCRAVNREAKKAQGEWLFIVNDDMYFPKDWDKHLTFPSACFSPNLLEPLEQGSAPPFLKLDAGFSMENFNRKKVDSYTNTENTIENGFNLPFFIYKDLWDCIGGYDENYDPWGTNSDSDLEYKVVLAGVQPKRKRDMLVYHFGSKSGSHLYQDYWQKNFQYFIDKWGFERISSPQIWNAELNIPIDKLKFKPYWMKK